LSEQSVARQYASALFSVARRNHRVNEVRGDLRAFADLVMGHQGLRDLFDTVMVPPRKKRAVVDALLAASGDPSGEVGRMLTLMADRGRLALVEQVASAFEDRVMEHDRAVEADVVTAMPLADEGQQALADALGRATGRRVTISGRIDPAIIGGLVARVGSLVFDGSVTGQLNRMRQRVTAGV
jgi:F-type H+-transporting ATPase subunit delta